MDPLTELEREFAHFVERLYSGIGSIQEQAPDLDSEQRKNIVKVVSSELADSHKNLIQLINKLPDEYFQQSLEMQESEIHQLQRQYEQSCASLENVVSKAKNVHQVLEQGLDQLEHN